MNTDKANEIVKAVQVVPLDEVDVCAVVKEIFPPWGEFVDEGPTEHKQVGQQQLSPRSFRAPLPFTYYAVDYSNRNRCSPWLSGIVRK